MKSRQTFITAFVLLLALSPIAFLFFVWDSIPPIISTRFNLGEPVIKEQSRQTLIVVTIMLSVVSAGIFLLMRNLKRIDPKVRAHTPDTGFKRMGLMATVFLVALNYYFIFNAVYSWEVSDKTLFFFGGLLFAMLGNYMYNIKPNFFAGIRLPWTLNDENNWRLTHHLAGRMWFAGGFLLALLSWLLPEPILRPVFLSIMVLMVLVPCIYSFRLYRNKKDHSV